MKCSTPEAARCFEALSEAADGFDNIAVVEAASIILAQAIASGSLSVASAQATVFTLASAMCGDLEANWDAVKAKRKATRQ